MLIMTAENFYERDRGTLALIGTGNELVSAPDEPWILEARW